MDHKTVSEILKKYHVINDIVYNRVDNSRVTDEDIITESLLAWYLNEEAGRKHRTMVDELHNSRLPGANRGITLDSELSIPDNDTLIDSLISDYQIDGTTNDSPNNVAIRAILESENHIEIEETLINPSFLARPNRRLGIAALRYIARKNGIDIDINSIKITVKYNSESKKNIIDVEYTKKPIEKKVEEKQSPVVPPVLDPILDPIFPPPMAPETSADEPQMAHDSLIASDSNPITEPNTPLEASLGSTVETQLNSIAEEQDIIDVDTSITDDLQDQPKENDAALRTEKTTVEPKTDNNAQPGIWEKLRAGFKAAKDAAVGVGNKIGESVIDAVETHKEKMRNAKLDAQMPIEEVERMIQEAEAMGDTDSKKYWTNVLCQKQGLPLQYPELVEQKQAASIDSKIEQLKSALNEARTSGEQERESKLKERIAIIDEKQQQLKKLDVDTDYIKGLLNEAIASSDEVTASRMDAILTQIDEQKKALFREVESLVDLEQDVSLEKPVIDKPADPNLPAGDVVMASAGDSVEADQEEEKVSIDFIVDELKKAIAADDIDDIESLIALGHALYPYASTERYLNKIKLGYSEGAKDNIIALTDILKITLPGYEEELNKYEKSQKGSGNITM